MIWENGIEACIKKSVGLESMALSLPVRDPIMRKQCLPRAPTEMQMEISQHVHAVNLGGFLLLTYRLFLRYNYSKSFLNTLVFH